MTMNILCHRIFSTFFGKSKIFGNIFRTCLDQYAQTTFSNRSVILLSLSDMHSELSQSKL